MQHEGVITRPHSRRIVPTVSALLLGIAALAAPVTSARAGVTVHSPQEVLDSWTVRSGDRLYFQAPAGRLWELVTDIEDPVIRNPGQGDFFPADPAEVQAALDAITYPLAGLAVDVFILPYPRRELLPSSAEDNVLVLSPGVAPLSAEKVHALVAHELGHVIHRAHLPDRLPEGWEVYRALRGIEDTSVYSEDAVHRNRPHEIFAEDVRALFGGPLANYAGTVENPDLVHPSRVPGLETFLRALAEPTTAGAPRQLRLYPNPTRSGVRLALADEPAVPEGGLVVLSVFDVQGRLVARRGMSGSYRWDGRLASGAPAAPGLYFLRAVRGGQAWVGKVLVRR